MGFELTDYDAITPQRMYALVKLLEKSDSLPRASILQALQPRAINENTDAAERVYRGAFNCDLILESDDRERRASLSFHSDNELNYAQFRTHMQSSILRVTEEGKNNYLLNQIAAWYAVQNERVFSFSRADIEMRFNEELYPSVPTKVFRERSDYNAWRSWAEFLGWGWEIKIGKSSFNAFVPDATLRVKPLLPHLIPSDRTIPFVAFMENLKPLCPELDGGVLFERCWEASRGGHAHGNRLSLMLSTALRVLHGQGEVELIRQPDAAEQWSLFPAQTHITNVTHIRRLGTGA